MLSKSLNSYSSTPIFLPSDDNRGEQEHITDSTSELASPKKQNKETSEQKKSAPTPTPHVHGGRLPGRLTTTTKRRRQLVALLDHFRSLEDKGQASISLPPFSQIPALKTAFDDPNDDLQRSRNEAAVSRQKRATKAWVSSVSRLVMSRESKPSGNSNLSTHPFAVLDRRQLLSVAKKRQVDEAHRIATKKKEVVMCRGEDMTGGVTEKKEGIIEEGAAMQEPSIDLFAAELEEETSSVLTWLSSRQKEQDQSLSNP